MKDLFIFITVFFLFLINGFIYPQVNQEWVARYNGPGNGSDYASSLAVDGSGNVYVTGNSAGDYATLKYNSSGVQQWLARYNGPGNNWDHAYSLAVDGSGNVYVTGYSAGIGTGDDYATIKYNSSGVQQWVVRYNGPGNDWDHAFSLAVDGSGNVYVTGRSWGSGTYYDYATIKYNSLGVQQWAARYNGPGNGYDYARSLAVDGSGNVYATGWSKGSANYDYATIKYNSSGVQQWATRYNGPGNHVDDAYSIAVDGSGNVYVTGYSAGIGTSYDYATLKYNSSGVQQWLARYNGIVNGDDDAYSIAVDGSGNVYVTGTSAGSANYNYDYATLKYNSSGVQQWATRYNGPGNNDDVAFSLALDGSGNVYVTGYSAGIGTSYDYATLKYNSSGVQQWLARYSSPGNHSNIAKSLTVDGSGNVYVTGSSWESVNFSDYATIKYSQPIGIKPISNEIPEEFKLYQNYPNPFNPSTIINFQIPMFNDKGASSLVRLVIYDIIGSEVALLVNEELKPGSYEVDFDGSNYPSGVYFYKIVAGEFKDAKKMILIK